MRDGGRRYMSGILNPDGTERTRNRLVDFIRGGAMILVIVQHCRIPDVEYIIAFHMPFFFLISGYLFRFKGYERKNDMLSFIRKQFIHLMIPYFSFELINLLVSYVTQRLVFRKTIPLGTALESIILCINTDGYSGVALRLWFFPAMFFTSVFAYITTHICRGSETKCAFSAAAFLFFSWLVSSNQSQRSPFAIDISFMTTFFFLTGFLIQPYVKFFINFLTVKTAVFIVFFSGLFTADMTQLNRKPFWMYLNSYGKYKYAVSGALAGSLGFLCALVVLYRIIEKENSFLFRTVFRYTLWLGRNSIAVYPIHLLIRYFIVDFIDFGNEHIWLFHFGAMLALIVPAVNIVNVHFPFFLGKSAARTVGASAAPKNPA